MKIKDGLKKVLTGLVASVSGLLGAIGGAGKKETRRWGIPLTIASTAFAIMHHWTAFLAFALAGPMSIGYGLPGGDDKGSVLGRFWYRVCSQHHLSADILTRTTIGLVYALILALIALFRGNWAIYAWTGPVIVIILGITPFTWNKLGTYKLLGLDLLWGETVIYSMVSLMAMTQLIF